MARAVALAVVPALLPMRFDENLQRAQLLLGRPCNRGSGFHMCPIVGRIIQGALDDKYILALGDRCCLFAQHDVVDPLQHGLFDQGGGARCKPGVSSVWIEPRGRTIAFAVGEIIKRLTAEPGSRYGMSPALRRTFIAAVVAMGNRISRHPTTTICAARLTRTANGQWLQVILANAMRIDHMLYNGHFRMQKRGAAEP